MERAVQFDEKTGSGIAENIECVLFAAHLFTFLLPDDLLFLAHFNCEHAQNQNVNKIALLQAACSVENNNVVVDDE